MRLGSGCHGVNLVMVTRLTLKLRAISATGSQSTSRRLMASWRVVRRFFVIPKIGGLIYVVRMAWSHITPDNKITVAQQKRIQPSPNL